VHDDFRAGLPAFFILVVSRPVGKNMSAAAVPSGQPRSLTLARTLTHPRTVPALAYVPGGGQIVTACCDGIVRLWNSADGQVVREWSLDGMASAVAFSPDGTLLAAGNTEGDLFVWEMPSGRERFFRHSWQGALYGLVFTPDGGLIASSNQRGTLSLWDAAGGGDRGQMVGHQGQVWAVCLVRFLDTVLLGSGGGDGTVRCWDPATRQVSGPAFAPGGDPVTAVACTPDGRWLAAANLERGVRLWVLLAQGAREYSTIETGSPAHAVAWPPTGDLLAVADAAGVLSLWSLPAGDAPARPLGRHQGHTRPPLALAFDPSGRQLASAGEDGAAHLWTVGE
jgi:WD40 repeat protein